MFQNMMREKYFQHKIMHTDGSQSEGKVGSAAAMGDIVKAVSLPEASSILTSETVAFRLASELIKDLPHGEYLICSDLLSFIQDLPNLQTTNNLTCRAQLKIHSLIQQKIVITIVLIPSHVFIPGNEEAAKFVINREAEFYPIPFDSWYPLVKNKMYDIWENMWKTEQQNLTEIKDSLKR